MESQPQNPEFRINPENFHVCINSFLASSQFCRMLKTIANSLEPDQDRQNVSPDLAPNCLTL